MTMLRRIFHAGRVRRWHTNPVLSRTDDYLDGHHARVARIILALHPNPSIHLITAALTHDDGESETGDMPAPFKNSLPDPIRAALDTWEASGRQVVWCEAPHDLSVDDAAWLKLADRLDAYMWARHHGANMSRDGWPEARSEITSLAFKVAGLTPGVTEYQVCDAITATLEAME